MHLADLVGLLQILLDVCFRCNPELLEYFNRNYYGGKLRAHPSTARQIAYHSIFPTTVFLSCLDPAPVALAMRNIVYELQRDCSGQTVQIVCAYLKE